MDACVGSVIQLEICWFHQQLVRTLVGIARYMLPYYINQMRPQRPQDVHHVHLVLGQRSLAGPNDGALWHHAQFSADGGHHQKAPL
jgi:hypothetical protein